MMMNSAVDVVRAWLGAVNAGDVDGALAMTSADVTIVGPRGTATGHEVLRGWMTSAGATFQTRATYAAEAAVVVAQHGVWRDESGAVRGEADVATRFRVEGGRVAELARYDSVEEALRTAGLSEGDRVGEPN